VPDPGGRLECEQAAARMGREPEQEELVLVGGKRRLNPQRLIKARESTAGAQDPPPGKLQQALKGAKRDGERICPSAVSIGRGNFFPSGGQGCRDCIPGPGDPGRDPLKGAALPDCKVQPDERPPGPPLLPNRFPGRIRERRGSSSGCRTR
jgi:hypothetical protein